MPTTHISSRALVDPSTNRYAQLPRQAPDLSNLALTYDRGPISGRAAWSYQGPNIVSYGDGTATANGDNYFYAHSQIDASLSYNFSSAIQLQLQALNLNNAVFGLQRHAEAGLQHSAGVLRKDVLSWG